MEPNGSPSASFIAESVAYHARLCLGGLLLAAVFALWLWNTFAIYYSNLPSWLLRSALASLYAVAVPLAFVTVPDRPKTLAGFFVSFVVILVWWLTIAPSSKRDWSPDQVLLPHAIVDENRVTVYNIRHCDYTSIDAYAVRHYNKSFDLEKLRSLDFIVEQFSFWQGAAHTFLSFGFEGGDYLAISVEIRKEKHESYSAWKGLFKRFEITYVIGDERDLVKLRSNFRNNPVHVYPIRVSHQQVRALLVDMLERTNRLRDQPEWYNTLTSTCTTNILSHLNRISPRKVPYNLAVLFPGYSDRLVYRLGLLDTDLPLEDARERYRINDRARRFRDSPDFSMQIRQVQ